MTTILEVLEAHVQSARNKRCTCGWRPTWPDSRIGAEYFQHREHLAQELELLMQQKISDIERDEMGGCSWYDG